MGLVRNNYCGLTNEWKYDRECVYTYIPTYNPKYLKRFLHPAPKNPWHKPHKWTVTEYGQINHYENGPNKTPTIDEKVTKDTKSKVGSSLYDSRAVDPTMLPNLN